MTWAKMIFLLLLLSPVLFFQDSSRKEKNFNLMLGNMLNHSVEEVTVHDIIHDQSALWVDARERNEYAVSRIKHAIWVGYDDFDLKRVSDIEKDKEIIVYCSIGYRSEKVAEKLKRAGYKNVKNLYGGIFSWVNNDQKVYDSLNHETKKVHAYNRIWGVWLDKGEKVY